MNVIAVFVRKNLNFDVARANNRFFDVNFALSPKLASASRLRGFERVFQILLVLDEPHSFAAAARRSFEHHRITEFRRRFARFFKSFERFGRSRHDRNARFNRDFPRDIFPPIASIASGEGPMKVILIRHFADEFRVFRQKTVTRMNRFRAGFFRRFDNFFPAQIAFADGGAPIK
jgi:hypothetical protein